MKIEDDNVGQVFSYASSSTLHPRQRVSESVVVSDSEAWLGACELVLTPPFLLLG